MHLTLVWQKRNHKEADFKRNSQQKPENNQNTNIDKGRRRRGVKNPTLKSSVFPYEPSRKSLQSFRQTHPRVLPDQLAEMNKNERKRTSKKLKTVFPPRAGQKNGQHFPLKTLKVALKNISAISCYKISCPKKFSFHPPHS